jgi:hypothetical protein
MKLFNFDFKRFKKKSSEEHENIFKTISNRRDSDCIELNNLCYQDCVFDKNTNNDIVKHCKTNSVYVWETIVYLYLLDKKISPLVTGGDGNTITYKTNSKISLYRYLKQNRETAKIKIILNELFGFVCKFRDFNFLHGNLHIHNIYVNPDKTGRFYVIDFSNSFLLDNNTKQSPKYQRSSYIGEMDNKITSLLFEYWDMFTLYVSIKLLLKDNLHQIHYLETVIGNYIKQTDVLERFTEEYLKYNDSNILQFHIHDPYFVNR